MEKFLETLPAPGDAGAPIESWPLVDVPGEKLQSYMEELRYTAHPGLQEVRFNGRRWHFFLSFGAQRRCQNEEGRSVIDEIMKAAGPLFRLAAVSDLMEIALDRRLAALFIGVKDDRERVLSPDELKKIVEEAGGSGNISHQLAKTYATLSLGDLQTSGALMLYAGVSTFYPVTLGYVEDRLGVDDFKHLQEIMLSEVQKAMDLREEMGDAASPKTNGQTPSERSPGEAVPPIGGGLDSTPGESSPDS